MSLERDIKNYYYLVGNPYYVDEEFYPERMALSGDATIHVYDNALMRNVAFQAVVITDDDDNILYTKVQTDVYGAYYNMNAGLWYSISRSFPIGLPVSELNVESGERIHVTLISVPEYFIDGRDRNIALANEFFTSDILSENAKLSTSFVVDKVAPVAEYILPMV